jgi:hypothetical protein
VGVEGFRVKSRPVDERSGRAKALVALAEIELEVVGDVAFVLSTIELHGFACLPRTKDTRKLLILDENGAAFFAGEQTGVVTDLVGTVMVIDLGNDQITLNFDLFRVLWLCFLDDSDDLNLDFGWDDYCLGSDHTATKTSFAHLREYESTVTAAYIKDQQAATALARKLFSRT